MSRTPIDIVRLRVMVERRSHSRPEVIYSTQLITPHHFGQVSEFGYKAAQGAIEQGVLQVTHIDGMRFIVRKPNGEEKITSQSPIIDYQQLVSLKRYAKSRGITYRQSWELVAGKLIPVVRIDTRVYVKMH